MTNYYYFYDETEGTFHKWQEKTTISKANKYAQELDHEAPDDAKIGKVTTIDKAIEVLATLSIVEGRKEDYN